MDNSKLVSQNVLPATNKIPCVIINYSVMLFRDVINIVQSIKGKIVKTFKVTIEDIHVKRYIKFHVVVENLIWDKVKKAFVHK